MTKDKNQYSKFIWMILIGFAIYGYTIGGIAIASMFFSIGIAILSAFAISWLIISYIKAFLEDYEEYKKELIQASS